MTNAIEIAVAHQLGTFTLAADFASDGRLTALFGRSGSGKTSLVNIIAGLIRPQRGRIAIDGQVLLDSERGVFVRSVDDANHNTIPEDLSNYKVAHAGDLVINKMKAWQGSRRRSVSSSSCSRSRRNRS